METNSEPLFNVSAIADYLTEYKDQLSSLYKWNKGGYDRNVFNEREIQVLEQSLNAYEKDKKLREIVRNKLESLTENENDKRSQLYVWIVNQWGGISKGNGSKLLKRTKTFLENKPSFDRIASTSKIGAFLYPDKYVIYDSRIAYSLNWILLKQNAGNVFFPIPEGRNARMQAIDVMVLIRLKNIERYSPESSDNTSRKFISQVDAQLFIDKDKAYFEMNKLIKSIHQELWSKDAEDYYHTEMLLFAIADTIIYKDITDSMKLQLLA